MALPENIQEIIQKKLSTGLVSAEERLQLMQWFESAAADQQLFENEAWQRNLLTFLRIDADQQQRNEAMNRFIKEAGFTDRSVRGPRRLIPFRWIKYAAAVIIVAGLITAVWLLITKEKKAGGNEMAGYAMNILPGSSKAILTLADGTAIALDSLSIGNIAQQGNASIVRDHNGGIQYELKGSANKQLLMNSLRTPNGGQYKLVLPDGTAAWLNAGSAIAYPAEFVEKERRVSISGEVYFEVQQDKAKPFIVAVQGGANIQVLGTSFNINAYQDDGKIRTTVVEGLVKVAGKAAEQNVLVRPGQQAVLATNAVEGIDVLPVGIDQVISWKNGIFDFTGRSFQSVMKDIERWYDVKIVYENGVPTNRLKGKMDRGVQLTDLIGFLKGFGIQVKQDGRILVIGTGKKM